MQCERCGAEVVEQSVYCHKCGHRVGQPAAGPSAGPSAFKPAPAAPTPPLEPDRIVWEGTFSPKALYGTFVACALISLAILAGGLIFFAPLWPISVALALLIWVWPLAVLIYRRLAVHYRLATQRFIHQRGILKRVTDRIEVIDMDDITFEQGIVQRMLGVGTLRITSSDRTHPKLILPGIDDVARVAGLIDDARRAERNRRGVYIESV
jgi:membrane protein YdbS with pleckstrin-like domain